MRIPILPKWAYSDLLPAFHDVESGTAIQQTAKLYAVIKGLVDDYNKFAEEVNITIEKYMIDSDTDQEKFKDEITKLVHDYIITIDAKIAHQDREIQESIIYIKDNIVEGVTQVIKQMEESGELDEALANSFNELGERVVTIENYTTELLLFKTEAEERITNLEVLSNSNAVKLANIYKNNVEEMIHSENLKAGDIVQTLGYYSPNDNGGAIYLIRELLSNEVEDKGIIHFINTNLVAEMIIKNKEVNIKQFGSKGDGITDDTEIINYVVNTLPNTKINKIYFEGTFKISSSINVGSGKDLVGIKENLQFNNYGTKFITSENITMINCVQKSNILIKNINLEHPTTNTKPVIDISGVRYFNIENVQVYHEGTTLCSAIAIDDTLLESAWSGYINLKNFRASYYNVAVKSKATLIKLENCVLNHCGDYNIYFLGEVCSIDSCDISYSTSGKAIKSESVYDLNIINSYLEGFYIDRCFEHTNNIDICLTGCKGYKSPGLTLSSGVRIESSEKYPQPFRNIKNSLKDGYVSFNNMIVNGKFSKSLFNWVITATNEIIIKDKTELETDGIGLPVYYKNALKINNGNIIQNFKNTLNKDEYITLGYWMFLPEGEASPYVLVQDKEQANTIIQDRPAVKGKWNYYTTHAKVTEDMQDKEWKLRIVHGGLCYITGISIMKGICTNIDAEYTPNADNVITDNLIIKGNDNNYYKIIYNVETQKLELTQVNSID